LHVVLEHCTPSADCEPLAPIDKLVAVATAKTDELTKCFTTKPSDRIAVVTRSSQVNANIPDY